MLAKWSSPKGSSAIVGCCYDRRLVHCNVLHFLLHSCGVRAISLFNQFIRYFTDFFLYLPVGFLGFAPSGDLLNFGCDGVDHRVLAPILLGALGCIMPRLPTYVTMEARHHARFSSFDRCHLLSLWFLPHLRVILVLSRPSDCCLVEVSDCPSGYPPFDVGFGAFNCPHNS